MMNQKLLFFDLDGTLLKDESASITESAVRAMRMAQENGHLCFVNSGRPMGSIGGNITNYPFDGYVCGCGTYISYQGEEIIHHVIDQKIIKELIDWNERERIDIFFEGKSGLFFPPEAEFKDLDLMETYFRSQGSEVAYYQYGGSIEEPIEKFSMWYDPEDPPIEYRAYLEQHFDIIERAADFWEVIPKGYSKASGIDELLDYLGYDLCDTISFGDSQNDIAMLEHTKEAVVMGNGDENLKAMATYVTTDIDEDGIYHAMKHFGLF
jgi:hypothetical protein